MTPEELATLCDDLLTMCDEAERAGQWLNCSYQDIWFSPHELRVEIGRGRFWWDRVNWQFRDPREHAEYLDRQIAAAQAERSRFAARAGI